MIMLQIEWYLGVIIDNASDMAVIIAPNFGLVWSNKIWCNLKIHFEVRITDCFICPPPPSCLTPCWGNGLCCMEFLLSSTWPAWWELTVDQSLQLQRAGRGRAESWWASETVNTCWRRAFFLFEMDWKTLFFVGQQITWNWSPVDGWVEVLKMTGHISCYICPGCPNGVHTGRVDRNEIYWSLTTIWYVGVWFFGLTQNVDLSRYINRMFHLWGFFFNKPRRPLSNFSKRPQKLSRPL